MTRRNRPSSANGRFGLAGQVLARSLDDLGEGTGLDRLSEDGHRKSTKAETARSVRGMPDHIGPIPNVRGSRVSWDVGGTTA